MTAPAIVRRWNDPAVRVGRAATEPAVAGDDASAVRARATECLVRLRRLAPAGAVLLTALVLHAGVVPHLAVKGAAPDFLLVAVVAVACSSGGRAGAGFGFAAGLGADLFAATPLGTSALAYTLLGHALGRSSPQLRARSAAALCHPGAPCFSCRAGRHRSTAHPAHPAVPAGPEAPPPSPARRRAAARRTALRRSTALTLLGVGGGRLAATVVATSFGGAAFPGVAGLVHIAAVAALSAPLGPAAAATVRRVTGGRGSPA